MPQLMPFYWVNSVFMILYIVMTLIFFYFYKNKEDMNMWSKNMSNKVLFNFVW